MYVRADRRFKKKAHLSHPVTWQFVNLPLSGLLWPLVFNLSGCKMYRSVFFSHGRTLLIVYWADVAWEAGGTVGGDATAGNEGALSLPAAGSSDKFFDS